MRKRLQRFFSFRFGFRSLTHFASFRFVSAKLFPRVVSMLHDFFFFRLCFSQEAFDAQSFVNRLLGFGDVKGLVQQLQESQEGSGDPKEIMYAFLLFFKVSSPFSSFLFFPAFFFCGGLLSFCFLDV